MTHEQPTPAPVEVTQADREAAEAFWNVYCGGNDLAWRSLSAQSQRETMRAFARHRIAHSAPAGEVEPVAWMYDGGGSAYAVFVTRSDWRVRAGWTETPLYTHPAPPADLVELVTILHQYRSDMLRPPAPDSRERRVSMIDAAIAKFGRDA